MGLEVGYGFAALAGLASFLSPCILPIVPFYLCYLTGLGFEALAEGEPDRTDARRQRLLIGTAIAFSLGVTAVFVALGASATAVGQLLRDWFDVLRYVAAAVIAVMGLHFLGVLRIGLLNRQVRIEAGARGMGLAGAFLIGMAFAFGWTPCVGPVLSTILFMAGSAETAGQGASLLLVYSLGMTLPFVLAAAFSRPFLRWARGFRRHLATVERAMGGALVLFAVLIVTNSISTIAGWMLQIAPDIGILL